jgi:hypothetical protein
MFDDLRLANHALRESAVDDPWLSGSELVVSQHPFPCGDGDIQAGATRESALLFAAVPSLT